MSDKKFIVTKDEATANKMIANRFKLISDTAGVYVFINKIPETFSFSEFDVKKLHFTNNLHL